MDSSIIDTNCIKSLDELNELNNYVNNVRLVLSYFNYTVAKNKKISNNFQNKSEAYIKISSIFIFSYYLLPISTSSCFSTLGIMNSFTILIEILSVIVLKLKEET